MVSEATVLRAGEKSRVSSADLVPGDIVILQAGDKVPADMCLIESRDLRIKEGRWEVQGDPTEGALIVSAMKGGLSVQKVSGEFPRMDVIPFESERQYMATLHDAGLLL